MSGNSLITISEAMDQYRDHAALGMSDFSRFAEVSMFCHDGKKWHGQIEIGAGGAVIEIGHWGTSAADVWENISRKFWAFVDDII